MKMMIRWMLAVAVAVAVARWNATAFAQLFQGAMEEHASLTIKPDGACLFTSETVETRTAAEQQVRMMERYRKMSEATEEEEGGTNSVAGAEAAPTPFTDAELAKKIREMVNENFGANTENADQKLDVEVKKDAVNITTTHAYASLEEMLKEGRQIWQQGGVMFENVRFETDTNSLLRVTLIPESGIQRYLKDARAEWKLAGLKTELKLVFPGKVVASGFPETQTNVTWLAVDAKKEQTLDAMMKLYEGPVVITAEAGGLKLTQPLELKNLQRNARERGETGEELPLTDAGPGFTAEAQTITTTVLHVFPGGESYFKSGYSYIGQQTGAVVTAKLFVPKGRTLLSVSGVRALKAVDDKGRAIAPEAEDDERGSSYVVSGGSADANSTPIQLRLQLPQPDAQAIDEISAEAVAVTAGSWKEMTLMNIQESATNEIDLAGVLPGAKLVITKFTSKNNQLNLQARIKGPRTVRRLDIRAKIRGSDHFNSSFSERNFSTKGGESTRTVMLQGYSYSDEHSPVAGSIIVIVRYPEDLRRERVHFELKGLDLL